MSVFCPNIKSPVWIKHTELVGNDLNYLSWIGNKGYPMELNSKGKPSTLYADLVKEYKDEKLAARIKALTFSKYIMEKLGDVKKDSKGEYKLEDVKKILTLSKEPISQIKLGVSELFEANPELAKIGTQEQYSKYLDTIFPNYINNFAYEAVEEFLVANKIIDRKC